MTYIRLIQKQKLLIQYYEIKEQLKESIDNFNRAIKMSFIVDKIMPNYETYVHKDIISLNKEIDNFIVLRDSILKDLENN